MVKERLNGLYEAERRRISTIDNDRGDYENPVFGRGPDAPRVMFIGEAPGGEEAAQGCPFVGKAGKQLNELLAMAGIDRSLVYVTNTVKFRPVNRKPSSVSNRTPSGAEVRAGLPLLAAEIGLLGPEVIVTLGNTPLKAVYAMAGKERRTIGDVHGRPERITVSGHSCILIPQYHPASVIYNRGLMEVLREDIAALGRYINNTEDRQ